MQQILSKMRKAIEEYNMIDEGDKIAVCVSGGKDSITMLNGLKALQRFYPKCFELIAISINPGFEFFDTEISFVSFFVNECTFDEYRLSVNVNDLRFRANTTGAPIVKPRNVAGAMPEDSIVNTFVIMSFE